MEKKSELSKREDVNKLKLGLSLFHYGQVLLNPVGRNFSISF